MSVNDAPIPAGASYVIGLVIRPSDILLTTVAEVYSASIRAGATPVFTKLFVASDFIENMDTSSSVALNPGNYGQLFYSSVVAFAPAVTSILVNNPHTIDVHPVSGAVINGSITTDSSGNLYFYSSGFGIGKFNAQDPSFPSLFTTGISGPGALSGGSNGLAVVNNVIYALDLTDNRIDRYDATTGSYLGAFNVTGDEAKSSLAVSDNGRLYLTIGNGDGNIYDATTGASIGYFEATANNQLTPEKGDEVIAIDNATGYFYEDDAATGLHTFFDPALTAVPEPASSAALAGLASLGFAAALRRKRRRLGSGIKRHSVARRAKLPKWLRNPDGNSN